jgi:peptide/nickel transport system permease protein
MFRYAWRRVPSALVVLAAASAAIFSILRLIPGDPAVVLAGPEARAETIAALRTQLGLDTPLPAQYVKWLVGVATGDLGQSYLLGAPIGELISHAAAASVELALASMSLALLVGLVLGVLAAVVERRDVKVLLALFNALSFSVPAFVSGLVLVLVFAVGLGVLPAGGGISPEQDPIQALRHLILPAITLALPVSAVIARYMQTALRQVLGEDYIRTAMAKGIPFPRIVQRHALPNALPPVITIAAVQIGGLLGGVVVVESVFAWPGLGRLLLNAMSARDYLVVQDLLLLAVSVFIVLQVVADIVYARVDPRVHLEA